MININELERDELLAALEQRGEKPPANTGDPKLRVKLRDAMNQLSEQFIFIEGAADGSINQGGNDTQSGTKKNKSNEPMAYTINLVDDDSGDDVRGCANCKPYILQRGVDVKVSAGIYHSLNDAKRIFYPRDKTGKIIGEGKLKHRYPFAIIEKHYS